MLGSFHPPQGYTLINKHPNWLAGCDKLTAGEAVRELIVDTSATVR